MDQDPDSPPTFWFQPPRTTTLSRRPPINPVVLIPLLPTLLLSTLLFFLSQLLSQIPETMEATSLWDLFIVFLVFFAILCGLFATRNYNVSNPENNLVPENYVYRGKVQVDGDLRRYLDSMQESMWGKDGNLMWFSDDLRVDLQYSSPVSNRVRRSEGGKESVYGSETVTGDTGHRPLGREAEEVISGVPGSMVEQPSNEPESMVEPPATTPPASVNLRRRRTSRSQSRDETVKATSRIDEVSDPPPLSVNLRRRRTSRSQSRDETVKVTSRIDEVRQVSPPPPAKSEHRLHTEVETTITSFDDQRKRKRKNNHKKRNMQPLIPSIQPPPPPTSPPSPPLQPPPPPPTSIFSNLFKSSGISKRFHSSKTSLPPAPPPPPSIINILIKTVAKSRRLNSSSGAVTPSPPPSPSPAVTSKRMSHIQPSSLPSVPKSEPHRRTDKPPLPTKASNNYTRDAFPATVSKSPLTPIPPPFKTPATTFERRDAVDLRRAVDDGDSFGPNPISFPSPDVNAKAESYICRCKNEWRMDKINSLKNKHGPISSTSPK